MIGELHDQTYRVKLNYSHPDCNSVEVTQDVFLQ